MNSEISGISAQVAAMRQGIDYRFRVTVRGLTVFLRPLTISEVNLVYQKVVAEMSQMPEIQRTTIVEHTKIAQKTLAIASSDPMKPTVEPELPEYVLGQMTQDEISAIYDEYVSIVDKVNPSFEMMSEEDVRVLVDEVKKNQTRMTDLSFLELASITQFLLSTSEMLPQDN